MTVIQPNSAAHQAEDAASRGRPWESWSWARREKISAASPSAIVKNPAKQDKHTATTASAKWVLTPAPFGPNSVFGGCVCAGGIFVCCPVIGYSPFYFYKCYSASIYLFERNRRSVFAAAKLFSFFSYGFCADASPGGIENCPIII